MMTMTRLLRYSRSNKSIIIFLSMCGTAMWCKPIFWPSPCPTDAAGSPSLCESKRKTTRSSLNNNNNNNNNDMDCQDHHIVVETLQPQRSRSRPHPRINMTLRRGHLMQHLFHKHLVCDPTHLNMTRHMHPSMRDTPGIFDFTTFLSTDLKILVMGDSVGIQISQTLEEMLGGKPENRKVFRYWQKDRECLHISAPTRGGGVIAGYRLLNMLLMENLNKPLPNRGPGWRMEDVHDITHHTYNTTTPDEEYTGYSDYHANGEEQPQRHLLVERTRQVGSFDVLFFHIPIGWMRDYNTINNKTMMETVLLAGELFGVETIVFNVPSFTNNIIRAKHLQSLRAAQNRILQFSKDFVTPNKPNSTTPSSVKHVLTLRTDRLLDETMEWNARLMGMIPNAATVSTSSKARNATTNTTTAMESDDEHDWRLVTVEPLKHNTVHIHHVAQTCSALPSRIMPPFNRCPPNYFSRDGMHLCTEKIGGRIFAGLGCVLGCVYNNNEPLTNPGLSPECQHSSPSSSKSTTLVDHDKDVVLDCSNACNDRYLSLTSVDTEVLD
jgi:hypothetical protein